MDSFRQQIIDKFKDQDSVIGISLVVNPSSLSAVTDGFDDLLLIVCNSENHDSQQYHYIKDNRRIQERWISPQTIDHWIVHGTNRGIVYWIVKGEILLDREKYMESLRQKVHELPGWLRQRKLLMEFALFLRSYLYCKEYVKQDHLLDAYNYILETIHHWARLTVLEEGIHPETTVWSQVKSINPGVYKLYEELAMSSETLKQRVELVLLACEFSVMSKMKHCCKPLLDLLAGREPGWSLQELRAHPELAEVQSELPLLLNKLVMKGLAKEKMYTMNEDATVLELRYSL